MKNWIGYQPADWTSLEPIPWKPFNSMIYWWKERLPTWEEPHKPEMHCSFCVLTLFNSAMCVSLCVFGLLTVDSEVNRLFQGKVNLEIECCALVRCSIRALDRFQYEKTIFTLDIYSLNIKKQELRVKTKQESDRGCIRETNLQLNVAFSLSNVCMKWSHTFLANSKGGWGFPSVSHFMVTVSPSLTGWLVLNREK